MDRKNTEIIVQRQTENIAGRKGLIPFVVEASIIVSLIVLMFLYL